jgi:DNA-3-methyladenine glycosylase
MVLGGGSRVSDASGDEFMAKRLPHGKRLTRDFYNRSTELVARDLLGKLLLRRAGGEWSGGLIVETEAYLAEGDLASHSARGETAGNRAMFGPPGTLYVYPIHAKWCMNAVTEATGRGAAVLIRAIEPRWGLEQMRCRRGVDDTRRLTRGPAMLCQSLAIDRRDDGTDLTSAPDLLITEPKSPTDFDIAVSPRIGIRRSADRPLRFFVRHNRFVSGRRRDHGPRPATS